MEILKNEKLAILLYIIVYIVVAYIVHKLVQSFFIRLAKKSKNKEVQFLTIIKLLQDIIRFVILIVLVIAILSKLGVDVGKIIAGLGVASVVIGLAFQDLLKDIIAGFSMIIEGYCSIGDTVEINGFKGVVTSLGVKTTKVLKYDGSMLIINNREISHLINYSKENTLAGIDFKIDISEDTEKVISIIEKALDKLEVTDTMVSKPVVLGILDIDETSFTVRVNVLNKPEQHYANERLIRTKIINILNKEKVKTPYARIKTE